MKLEIFRVDYKPVDISNVEISSIVLVRYDKLTISTPTNITKIDQALISTFSVNKS